jgi:single-strand DNA-binding protein
MLKVLILGNLTADPEEKKFQNGTSIANFTVATNRKYKDQEGKPHEEAEFTRCVAYGKTAETIIKYFRKGNKIYVEGRLKTTVSENPAGEKRYFTNVVVGNFEFVESKKSVQQSQKAPMQEQKVITGQESSDDLPDDLPF